MANISLTEELDFFKASNCLSELVTLKDKAQARKNLGINISDLGNLQEVTKNIANLMALLGYGLNNQYLTTSSEVTNDGTLQYKYVWKNLNLCGKNNNEVLKTILDDDKLVSEWSILTGDDILIQNDNFSNLYPLASMQKASLLNTLKTIINYIWFKLPEIVLPYNGTYYKEVGTTIPGGLVLLQTSGTMKSASYTSFDGTTKNVEVETLVNGIQIPYEQFTAQSATTTAFSFNCTAISKDGTSVSTSRLILYIFRFPSFIGFLNGNQELTDERIESLLTFGSQGSTTGAKTLAKQANKDVTYCIIVPQPLTLSKITDSGSMNASVKDDFKLVSTPSITRNGVAHKYNVYRFHPTNPYTNSADFNITIA